MKQQQDVEFYKKVYDKRPKKSKYKEHFEMVKLEMEYERAIEQVSRHPGKSAQDAHTPDE
jgi:hypothetical protein